MKTAGMFHSITGSTTPFEDKYTFYTWDSQQVTESYFPLQQKWMSVNKLWYLHGHQVDPMKNMSQAEYQKLGRPRIYSLDHIPLKLDSNFYPYFRAKLLPGGYGKF